MFADTALASRIEAAEAQLTRAVALSARQGDARNAFVHPIGAGVAAFVRPGSPMNKVIGVGLEAPLEEADLDEIEGLYRARGEAVRFELSTLALPEVGLLLTARGYRLHGFENVLGRAVTGDARPAPVHLHIDRLAGAGAEPWARIAAEGFSLSDETGVVVDVFSREVIDRAVYDMAGAEGFERYVAYRGADEAGAACMRLDAEVALLCGATTLGPHRRRGIQGALLARRLQDAREHGAEIAVITTAGGTRSQANAMRQGFSLLYARAILVRDA